MYALAIPFALIASLGAQSTACGATQYPPELPAASALVDSAGAIADLAAFAAGSKPMLFSLIFPTGDSVPRIRALAKTDEAAAVALANYVRPQRPSQLWAIRVRIAGGDAPALKLERAKYCPPVPRSQLIPATVTGSVVTSGQFTPSAMRPGARFEAVIAPSGIVLAAHVTRESGIPQVDQRILVTIRRHRFKAALLDDEPIEGVWRSEGELPRP